MHMRYQKAYALYSQRPEAYALYSQRPEAGLILVRHTVLSQRVHDKKQRVDYIRRTTACIYTIGYERTAACTQALQQRVHLTYSTD